MSTMYNVRIPQLSVDQRAKWIDQFPGVSRSPQAIPMGYRAIYAKAVELGLPEHFRDDLEVWDRGHLTKDRPAVFGWSPYNSGTDIFYPEVDGIEHVQVCARVYASHAERAYFFWNGTALEQVTSQGLIERLAQHLDVAAYERRRDEAAAKVGAALYEYQQSYGNDAKYMAVLGAREQSAKAAEALRLAKEYRGRYAPTDALAE